MRPTTKPARAIDVTPAEHVPEEKEQDSRRGRREEGLDLRGQPLHPAHRQAEEDRQAGDRAEQQGLCGAHLVRVTLQISAQEVSPEAILQTG